MLKKSLFASIVIFIVWTLMDFFIHGVLLKETYQETANLWRPENEMNMALMSVVTFIFCICFVAIYSLLIKSKSLGAGIKFGVLFGIAIGTSMGFGSYGYMPIPLDLAVTWFIGTVAELSIAGLIVGFIIKSSD